MGPILPLAVQIAADGHGRAIYSRPWKELYDELQAAANEHKWWKETKEGGYWEVVKLNPLDILKLQHGPAKAVAPYIHKAQPEALEIEQRARGVMIIGEDVTEAEAGGDDGLSLPPLPFDQSTKSDVGP